MERFHEEELVIELTGEKAKCGVQQMGIVQRFASGQFGETVNNMLEAKNDARGTEAQQFVEEFVLRQIQMHARHMLGTLEVVGTSIGLVIHDSLNLPPEQQSFWDKVLGRR